MTTNTRQGEASRQARIRWLECENIDVVTLNAHAVVEVLESTRPEAGREVLQVKRAQSNSPENTVVLGPGSLAAGDFGRCNDDNITHAHVTGAHTVGDSIGLASGGQSLVAGQMGWIYLGDASAPDSASRVQRAGGTADLTTVNCGSLTMKAQVNTDFCDTDATISVKNQRLLELGNCSSGISNPSTIRNLLKLAGSVDDYVYAVYDETDDLWDVLNVQHARVEYLDKDPAAPVPATDGTCAIHADRKRLLGVVPPSGSNCELDTTITLLTLTETTVLDDIKWDEQNCRLEQHVISIWEPVPEEGVSAGGDCEKAAAIWEVVHTGTECPTS